MIEKKLVLCSILAIAIGIATILPLAFSMSKFTAEPANDAPWFNAEMPLRLLFCNQFRANK